jgi:hypothetical protein
MRVNNKQPLPPPEHLTIGVWARFGVSLSQLRTHASEKPTFAATHLTMRVASAEDKFDKLGMGYKQMITYADM